MRPALGLFTSQTSPISTEALLYLRYGLQDIHGKSLVLPARVRDRPSRDGLALHWEHSAAYPGQHDQTALGPVTREFCWGMRCGSASGSGSGFAAMP